MNRLHDWQTHLAAAVRARRDLPFAWGTHDCCTFVSDCVQAMTGTDPMDSLRLAYHSEQEANELIESHGGLLELAGKAFGDRIPPGLAQVGDVGLVRTLSGPALAICNGTTWLCVRQDVGLIALDFSEAVVAWRV